MTNFGEEFITRVALEAEKAFDSDLNTKRRLRLAKEICSIYYYLRKHKNMPPRQVTLNELEITAEYLKEIGTKEINKKATFFETIFSSSRKKVKKAWKHYLEFGYFGHYTPWGKWLCNYPWNSNDISDIEWRLLMDIDSSSCLIYEARLFPCVVPPNAFALVLSLFEKRYVNIIDPNDPKPIKNTGKVLLFPSQTSSYHKR